jgi:hypothetical protein
LAALAVDRWNSWIPLIEIGSYIVQAVLLSPLAIAVHRFVLLGERTNRYPLEPGSSRYLRFVGFAILINIPWLIPRPIQSLIPGVQNNPAILNGTVASRCGGSSEPATQIDCSRRPLGRTSVAYLACPSAPRSDRVRYILYHTRVGWPLGP